MSDILIRPCPGRPGVFVSNTGGVYHGTPTRLVPYRQAPDKDGYMRVELKKVKTSVHLLVLETFVGEKPPGQVCRHLNDKPDDNRLENLLFGTPDDNVGDRARNGTTKLNPDSVRAIRTASLDGVPSSELAQLFGVSEYMIYRVVTRRSWKSVV